MKPKNIWRESLLIGVVLFLLLAVFFYDVFFLGKTFKVTTANSQALPYGAYGQAQNKPKFIPVNGTDAPVLEEPTFEFIKNNLRKGVLPLWNPHQGCGFPLIGMLEVGIFFPLNAILYIFPNFFSWDLLILTRFFLAGLFTFWFMRYLGFKQLPSLVSAIVFMFSGPMVLLQYWTVNVDILTPLLLLCMERLIRVQTVRSMLYTAVVVGLTFFAGHPEHIFLVNAYGFLFFCFRSFSLRNGRNLKKCFLLLSSAYLLGILWSSVVLFPFVYNLLFEFWHGHPPGTGLRNEEIRERILTLAVPHFFQTVPLTYQWDFAGWWGGYLGAIPLALSSFSLWNSQKRGLNYFFAVLAFLIISKEYGFFYINWIGYLPIFNTCRYAIHTPHLVAFTVAILAGMGLRNILLVPKNFSRGLIYTLTLIGLIVFNLFLVRKTPIFSIGLKAFFFTCLMLVFFQSALWLQDKRVFSRKIIPIILLGILCLELFSYIHRGRVNRFDSFSKVPYMQFINQDPERSRSYGVFWAFYPNTATGYEMDDLGIFFSLLSKRFVHFTNNFLIKNHFQSNLKPPALRMIPIPNQGMEYLDMLNIKYLITPPTETMQRLLLGFEKVNQQNPPVFSQEANIYFRANAFKRAFIVHKILFEPDEKKCLSLLKENRTFLREMAVIEAKNDDFITDQIRSAPAEDRSQANIIKYSADKVIIDADLEHAGFLVLSDTFHPDWKAFVDGKPAKIYPTNCLIRSVFLTEGQHRVEFIFRPFSFYFGLICTLLTSAVLILFWMTSKQNKSPSNVFIDTSRG